MTLLFRTILDAPRSIDVSGTDEPTTILPAPRPRGHRLDNIDLLRGAIMLLMALDHVRDFFHAGGGVMNPRDVTQPALFLTRWITHFCAPTFIFLAGMSAHLYGQRKGRTIRHVSWFLLTRGACLIALELTIINFGWTFDPRFDLLTLQVIWAIGCSMIALAAMVFLPRSVIGAITIVMIGGHNLLDGVHAAQVGRLAWLWNILHEPGSLGRIGGVQIFVLYPLIPWVGVMAAGYVLGPVMQLDGERRRATLVNIGVALVVIFILLRGTNIYGDPADMAVHASPLATLLSFLNCEKYPPSLLYLAMTLGPALIALAMLEFADGALAGVLITFGRAPLFLYVVHIYAIHLLSAAVAMIEKPPAFGFSLPIVYAIWLAVVAMLYPLCRWFAGVKRRRDDWWWLSYV